MNTITSIIRIDILLTLGLVAIIGFFSTPEDGTSFWLLKLILSKGIGVAAGYACYKLYDRWRKTDKWIKAYDEADERDDADNPLFIEKKGGSK